MQGVTVHKACALLNCCVHGVVKGGSACARCAELVQGSRPRALRGLHLQRVCIHGRIRSYCRPCRGASYCEHLVQRKTCWVCRGSEVCKHIMNKAYCAECGGRLLCQVCRQTIVRNTKVCRRCRDAAAHGVGASQG